MTFKRFLAVCTVTTAALFVACGGGHSPASGSTGAVVKNDAARRGGKLPVSTCVSANVDVGRSAGEIRFSVACRASSRVGLVGFSVGRRGFHRFSRHPAVSGPGAKNRYGSCERRLKEIIDCESRIDGKARIAGSLAVNPRTRCSEEISVTVAESSNCTGNVCPSGAAMRRIFDGLPAGC